MFERLTKHYASLTDTSHTLGKGRIQLRKLYDKYLPGWAHNEPELLARIADGIPKEENLGQQQRTKKTSLFGAHN
jgi:hypothetical protein